MNGNNQITHTLVSSILEEKTKWEGPTMNTCQKSSNVHTKYQTRKVYSVGCPVQRNHFYQVFLQYKKDRMRLG